VAIGVLVTTMWILGFWGILLGGGAGYIGWKLGRRDG
jgi:hypothetical protein